MTKRKAPEDKKKPGKPTVMTPDTIAKLEWAFSCGSSDLEACFYAGIAQQTLYDYQKRVPSFVERKAALKEKLALKARTVVQSALEEGDKDMAKWYLERKKKAEFTTRQEVTGADGGALISGVVVEFVGVDNEAEDSASSEGSVSTN